MARGELSSRQRADLDRAVRAAEQASRFEFSVFRGPVVGEPREFATRLHASLAAPARSVLVMVDPVARLLEVVTGEDVRRSLSDAEVRLAVKEMQTSFANGDDFGGLTRGIALLAEHARKPDARHVTASATSVRSKNAAKKK